MKKQKKIEQINKILAEFDPIGLIAMGAPSDEYLPEAKRIMSLFETADRPAGLVLKIQAIFISMFDEKIVGSFDFDPLARKIEKCEFFGDACTSSIIR